MDEHGTARTQRTPRKAPRHGLLALGLVGVVVGMVGLTFAAVPLYDLFCRVTGYGGTTQRADVAPEGDRVVDRLVTVRFDANTAPGMPWQFRPLQRTVQVKVGERALVFYNARNPTAAPVKGTATFNVTPDDAGLYFNKIECFCFVEQVLEPGEAMDMPVSFFIDPAIEDDPQARQIRQITLSYTFFPAAERSAAAGARGQGS